MSVRNFAAKLIGASVGFVVATAGVTLTLAGAIGLGTITMGVGPILFAEPLIELGVKAVELGFRAAKAVQNKLGTGFENVTNQEEPKQVFRRT